MCAKTEAMQKPVPRIVGDAVNATYAPFQVRLIYVDEAMDDMSYCGGTIISQRFVLTAKRKTKVRGGKGAAGRRAVRREHSVAKRVDAEQFSLQAI